MEWQNISEEAKRLIRKMLCYDPEQRLTAEEVLRDPWIVNLTSQKGFENPLIVETLKNLHAFNVYLRFLAL